MNIVTHIEKEKIILWWDIRENIQRDEKVKKWSDKDVVECSIPTRL